MDCPLGQKKSGFVERRPLVEAQLYIHAGVHLWFTFILFHFFYFLQVLLFLSVTYELVLVLDFSIHWLALYVSTNLSYYACCYSESTNCWCSLVLGTS